MTPKKRLEILLAAPRGLCAGVERAIEIVERALKKFGPPIYVKHEIVHNKYVVENLREKGVIFVEDIAQIPKGAVTIFSAHGVSDAVEFESAERNLSVIDATCPLVKKVHLEVRRHDSNNRKLVLIGHVNHPEVEGTSGRVKNKVYVIGSVEDVEKLPFSKDEPIAYVTQTTLSVDDTKSIIEGLRKRFTNLEGPDLNDICYATQNRQNAVKELLDSVDLLVVIGAKNSSNSNRLKDIGLASNKQSYLIDTASDFQFSWLNGVNVLGITAGASAPEILLENLLLLLKDHYDIHIKEIGNAQENIKFKLPKQLIQA